MSKKQKSDCPGSYEVSGYTTDSGKKVDSYTRHCWKHGSGTSGSGVTNGLNEGENPYPNKIFAKANPSEDTPTPTVPTGGGGNPDEIILETLLSLGSVAGRAYLSYLSNKKNENPVFSTVRFPNTKGGGQFIQSNYQNFPLSKFDPKKTETDIKNSMKNIENILKQKEISNNDISVIRSSLKNNVGSICNDIESISYRRSQQPEIPTVESMEAGKTIEQDRKQTIDNATNVITSINLAQNALKRNFDSVSMNSPEYNKKLYEYVRQSDELKKMSDSVMDLFQEAKSPTKNSINTVNKIRQDFGFAVSNIPTFAYNGTTGSAANVGNTIGFTEKANNRIKKLKKMFNNFNWSKIDDLMDAYIYAIYDDRFNSIETVNKLKEKICKDLNISKHEELLIIEEYNEPEIKQIIAGLNIKNPIVAIISIGWIWRKTNSSLDKFYKRPDINITNKELDIKNDMRHITGLAFLTKIFGADKARKLGYLKEHLDFFTHEDKKDTLIDFDNNEKGIAVAIQCPNLNMEEIIQKIYNVYIKNKRNLDK